MCDFPAVRSPRVAIAVDSGPDRVFLPDRIDEPIFQIPCALGTVGPGEANLRAMAVMLRDDIAVEGAADEIDHVLAALQLRSIAAAAIVDRDILGEHACQIGLVTCVDRTEIAVLELFDILNVRELLEGEGRYAASPKLAGGSPITATVVAPASSTEWIRQESRRERVSAIHQRPSCIT